MSSIQRDLEKLSTDFSLLVDETTQPFRWSFQRDAIMDIIPALDVPAALTFELARVINRGLGGQRPAIDADVLETVTEALLREYQCKLTYQTRNWQEPEEIVVQPFGLIFRDPNIYLIGTFEGREGVRQLVLHRATNGELVEAQVERPEDFDLDLYIHSGAMGILKSNKPVYLRLRCDRPALNHLVESPLGFDQLTEDIDDSTFEMSVTVGDTQDLQW